jgi:signal transduction histidine kinase
MLGDATLLRQVVQNLLANSLAYTQQKGKVSCKIFKENSNFVFEIQDNGIGIPNNDQHRIFEKMFRAANAIETKPYGTGLGLYIVDKMVAAMGGKVWFESKEGEGTTFWFSLHMESAVDK